MVRGGPSTVSNIAGGETEHLFSLSLFLSKVSSKISL